MRGNKKAVPGVTAPGDGTGIGLTSDDPQLDFTTLPGWKQARVALMLGYGKNAAITLKELAAFLNVNEREISRAVERERGAGIPICASTDSLAPGYYLPATEKELAGYRRSLQRRVAAVTRTLEAVERAHDDLAGQLRIETEVDG